MPPGLSPDDVAKRLRISAATAHKWGRELGYFISPGIRWRQQFRDLPPGLTYHQIAQRLGISDIVARNWANTLKYAVKLVPRGRPKHGNPPVQIADKHK